MEEFYGIIIGFGKGGKTLAADLAAKGKKVAMIEQSDQMYGGTCINVGCIPSKSLVHSAMISKSERLEGFKEKASFYQKAIEEKSRVTTMLRGKNFDKLEKLDLVKVYTGKATFLSSHDVRVELENETVVLKGEYIFINTGSRPVIPDIEGVAHNDSVFDSESLMEVSDLPERLAIIGGGHIGLEFASIYANFGSEVTVFQRGHQFMPGEDEDISEEILKVLIAKGIDFRFGTTITSIVSHTGSSVISYEEKGTGAVRTFQADAVLIATGRRPNTEGLDLQAAGVETAEGSAVKVDDHLRTTADNIWAMGDVNGGPQFTYISLDDFRIVKAQLDGGDTKHSLKERRNVPHSLFIDPAYSRVGLSEKEARALGYDVKIAKMSASAIPKAQVIHETKGILKAVIDTRTDRILGAMLFCAESYEMINTVKLAMDADLAYHFLRDQIFTHPTMSESLNDLFTI